VRTLDHLVNVPVDICLPEVGEPHVYENIGSSVGKEKVDREVTSRYAGFGLIFAILAALELISLGARWP
jgi:hypothetical protein